MKDSSKNERVMKSEIRNGTLIKVHPEDVDPYGHYECLEAKEAGQHILENCKTLTSISLPNIANIYPNTFNMYPDTYNASLKTLAVDHSIQLYPRALTECPNLECLILHGIVIPDDMRRLHTQLPENLKNIKISLISYEQFRLIKAVLDQMLPKDLAGLIQNLCDTLPRHIAPGGEPLESIVNRLDEVFLTAKQLFVNFMPSHTVQSQLLHVSLFAPNKDADLDQGIKRANISVDEYLRQNKDKTHDGVTRAKQLQYVLESKVASPVCKAVMVHAFLNDKTGGGYFGFLDSKGTGLVKALKKSIPGASQQKIAVVANRLLHSMGLENEGQKVNFENTMIKNLTEGKYDIPNLELTNEQILADYGDKKMSDFQSKTHRRG